MNTRSYKKAVVREVMSIPSVKRYINRIGTDLGFNTSMFKTKAGKYYGALQGFEFKILNEAGFSDKEKYDMLTNGKIDDIVDQHLVDYLSKRGIEIPFELMEYGGITTEILRMGRKEYMLLDNSKKRRGKAPLIFSIVKGKVTVSEELANRLIERRSYIIDYDDDVKHFFGKKARKRREERREKKHIRKLEKRQQKADNKLLRTTTKQDARTERRALATTSKVSDGITGRRSVAADVLQTVGDTNLIGQIGGTLGSLFGGGGAFPMPNDPNRFEGMDNPAFVGAIKGAEAGGISGGFNVGSNDKTLLYAGMGAGALLLIYMLKK